MSKITKATLKSFINKNRTELFVREKAAFCGMIDGLEYSKEGFKKAEQSERQEKYSLGIKGVWLVGGSRNFFSAYEEENFTGIEVYNCCGNFIIAIRKCNCFEDGGWETCENCLGEI